MSSLAVVASLMMAISAFLAPVEAKVARDPRQLFLIPSPSASGSAYYPQYFYPGAINEPSSSLPNYGESPARLFGLTNFLSGQQKPCPSCPTCPTCPAVTTCPAIPGPATITVAAATACTTPATLTTCSVGSVAPSGTISVNFATAAAGGAVITIVAQAPNTRIQVNCPSIPGGLAVATQTQALVANTPRIETGFAAVVVSGTAAAVNSVVACGWTSLP